MKIRPLTLDEKKRIQSEVYSLIGFYPPLDSLVINEDYGEGIGSRTDKATWYDGPEYKHYYFVVVGLILSGRALLVGAYSPKKVPLGFFALPRIIREDSSDWKTLRTVIQRYAQNNEIFLV